MSTLSLIFWVICLIFPVEKPNFVDLTQNHEDGHRNYESEDLHYMQPRDRAANGGRDYTSHNNQNSSNRQQLGTFDDGAGGDSTSRPSTTKNKWKKGAKKKKSKGGSGRIQSGKSKKSSRKKSSRSGARGGVGSKHSNRAIGKKKVPVEIHGSEELAKQAEDFMFEKIGHVLLKNFKQNMVPCPHCGRKFNTCNLPAPCFLNKILKN